MISASRALVAKPLRHLQRPRHLELTRRARHLRATHFVKAPKLTGSMRFACVARPLVPSVATATR